MAVVEDLWTPEGAECLKPLARKLGAVRSRIDGNIVVIETGYGPHVELGRGASVQQAVADVMKNAWEHKTKN